MASHAQLRPADRPSTLPPQLRASFERSAGELSDVQVRHDPGLASAGLAGSTVRSDIALNTDRHGLDSPDGRWVAAHELAHVVQQRGGTGGPRLGPSGLEAQADRAASAALRGAAVPALSRAAAGAAQHKVELRDVGRGEQSGFDRAGELVDRLNALAPNVLFDFDGTFLNATAVGSATLSEFERQMVDYCGDSTPSIPLRFTNRHGLLGDRVNGFHDGVFVDAWSSGYVDIDDLLASDDLGLQTALVHFIRERQATRNYARRIGSDSVDLSPGSPHQAEFDRAHGQGLDAEQEVLRGFFGDPSIHFIDRDNRVYRNDRRDIIRVHVREGRGAETGIQAISLEVVLHDTRKVVTAEQYLQILESERTAAQVERERLNGATEHRAGGRSVPAP